MYKLMSFALDYARYVLKGGVKFYAWLGFLAVLSAFSLYGFYLQNTEGLIVTGITSQIHDGLYFANLVFLVGVAAGAVTIVFPAYVYHHKAMHEVTVLGETLAVSSVIMVMLFVLSHMGRPERLWHMIPYLGIYNFPNSMLAWDVLVLNVYLVLNLVCGGYYLFVKYSDGVINQKFFMPIVYTSIVWALSIHTVTAFLISSLPARPMWFHSMMPIRFIVTAFAAGPCLIILIFMIIRKNTKFWIQDEAINLLTLIITWCLGIALFLTMSEVVSELYARTEHANGLYYLMFGLHGLTKLVPWFWGSLIAMIIAFVMFLIPGIRTNYKLLPIACVLAFGGIWVEKGMGLIVPGFIPTPIGEVTEYYPTMIEIMMSIGNWAIGFLILSILLKGSIGVLLGDVRYRGDMVEKSYKSEKSYDVVSGEGEAHGRDSGINQNPYKSGTLNHESYEHGFDKGFKERARVMPHIYRKSTVGPLGTTASGDTTAAFEAR